MRMSDENSNQIGANQTSQDDQSTTNQSGDDFVLDFGESGDLENTEQSSEEGIQSDGDSDISDSRESVEENAPDNDGDETDNNDFDISFDDEDFGLSDESTNENNYADENGNNEIEEQDEGELEMSDYSVKDNNDTEEQQDFGPENFDYSAEDNNGIEQSENGVEETGDYITEDENGEGNSEIEEQDEGESEMSDYSVEDNNDEAEKQHEDLGNDDYLQEENIEAKSEGEDDGFLDIDIPDEVDEDTSDNEIIDENNYDSNIEDDSSESKNQDNELENQGNELYEEGHKLFINNEEDFTSDESSFNGIVSDENQDSANLEDIGDNNQNEYESDDTNQRNIFSPVNDGEKLGEQPESDDTMSSYSLSDNFNGESENTENEVDLAMNHPDLLDDTVENSLGEDNNNTEDGAFNQYEDYLQESDDVNQNANSYQDVNEMGLAANDSETQIDESSLEEKDEGNNMDDTQTSGFTNNSESENGTLNDKPIKEDNSEIEGTETPNLDMSAAQEQDKQPDESALEIKTNLSGGETTGNSNQETVKEDANAANQNDGNMTFSLDQIINSDSQSNQQSSPVINTENIESSTSNGTTNKRMIGIVAGVVIFALLGVVAYLAFPKGSSEKQPDTIVAGIQPTETGDHGTATGEPDMDFPDENPDNPTEDEDLFGSDVGTTGEGGDIGNGNALGSSQVVEMDEENLDGEDSGDTEEQSPTPYIPDEDLDYGDDDSNVEDNQALINQIQEKLQSYKQQGEGYYSYGQERLDNNVIKNAKRIIYLCENYEKKIESEEGVDESSRAEVEGQILEKLSKITNGGLEEAIVVNNGHLDDDSYFDGKDEHLDYIYERTNW